MGKILLLILGLAGYGAYALVQDATQEKLQATPAASAPAPTSEVPVVAQATEAALALAGLRLAVAAPKDCSLGGLLSSENLTALYDTLPSSQSVALQSLLRSMPASPVAVYDGSAGLGLCVGGYAVILPSAQVKMLVDFLEAVAAAPHA